MTRVIYKYEIPLKEESVLLLPRMNWPMFAGLDPMGNLCLWAEVELKTVDERIERKVRIVGTGFEPPDHQLFEYLNTVRQEQFMWHIYIEIIE